MRLEKICRSQGPVVFLHFEVFGIDAGHLGHIVQAETVSALNLEMLYEFNAYADIPTHFACLALEVVEGVLIEGEEEVRTRIYDRRNDVAHYGKTDLPFQIDGDVKEVLILIRAVVVYILASLEQRRICADIDDGDCEFSHHACHPAGAVASVLKEILRALHILDLHVELTEVHTGLDAESEVCRSVSE